MNDQDRDLIAALAEGRLGGAAVEDAIARIEADSELASEYADQVVALELLQSSAVPQMTADERSTLRMNLAEQLGLAPGTAPAPTASKRRIPWWQPVFGLATAAAVVTAIVILPGTLTGGSADIASVEVAIAEFDNAREEELPTTTTQSSAATVETQEAPDDAGTILADEMDIAVYETESVELGDLLKQARGADSPDAVERRLMGFAFRSTVDLDSAEVERCLNVLADDIPEGVVKTLVIGAEVLVEDTIVHVGFDFGAGIEDALSFELESCSLIEHAPQG
jgi:hypothetical protein